MEIENYLTAKIDPYMQEILAVLEPTPVKFKGVKCEIQSIPHKERIECLIVVKASKEIVAKVNVWNDGRVEGGWFPK